jgi:hypothetical protein
MGLFMDRDYSSAFKPQRILTRKEILKWQKGPYGNFLGNFAQNFESTRQLGHYPDMATMSFEHGYD